MLEAENRFYKAKFYILNKQMTLSPNKQNFGILIKNFIKKAFYGN